MNAVLKAERSSDMLLALQENGMATKLKRRSSPLKRALNAAVCDAAMDAEERG